MSEELAEVEPPVVDVRGVEVEVPAPARPAVVPQPRPRPDEEQRAEERHPQERAGDAQRLARLRERPRREPVRAEDGRQEVRVVLHREGDAEEHAGRDRPAARLGAEAPRPGVEHREPQRADGDVEGRERAVEEVARREPERRRREEPRGARVREAEEIQERGEQPREEKRRDAKAGGVARPAERVVEQRVRQPEEELREAGVLVVHLPARADAGVGERLARRAHELAHPRGVFAPGDEVDALVARVADLRRERGGAEGRGEREGRGDRDVGAGGPVEQLRTPGARAARARREERSPRPTPR